MNLGRLPSCPFSPFPAPQTQDFELFFFFLKQYTFLIHLNGTLILLLLLHLRRYLLPSHFGSLSSSSPASLLTYLRPPSLLVLPGSLSHESVKLVFAFCLLLRLGKCYSHRSYAE